MLLAAVLTAGACVHSVPPPLFGPEGPIQNAAEVLGRVKANEQAIHTLKGDGRLTVDSPQGRGSLTLLVAVGEGARLHLEILDFFGRPLSILISDGTRFGLFQVQENRYYQGPATAENFARFLPMSLPPQELADLLRGITPRLPTDEVRSMRLDKDEGTYRLEFRYQGASQTLWVDTLQLRVRRSVRGGAQLEYRDFGPPEERHLPHQLTLSDPARKSVVTLRYSGKVAINAPLEASLFEPHASPGVPVSELSPEGELLSSDPPPK